MSSKEEPLTEEQLEEQTNTFIESVCNQLSEHLTSVQITGTKLNPDGSTTLFSWGSGDLYARLGSTRNWLESGGQV